MKLKIDFSYTPAQLKVFDDKNPRFITVAKGRRLGFTREVLSLLSKTCF